MTTWRMRIACWILKATNTLSEYVIFIAFPWQQWVRERASTLRYSTLPVLFILSRNKSWKLRWWMECCASILNLTFDTARTAELTAVLTDNTLSPWKFFVLISVGVWGEHGASEWGQKDSRTQGLYRGLNLKPPGLWCNVSTHCATDRLLRHS